ncbi:MAG: hypothetical protein HW414_1529, partial [Dehalococcoidia bacterium]|nr:hypothetical protein [Dehalococcoidia bacterium]
RFPKGNVLLFSEADYIVIILISSYLYFNLIHRFCMYYL